MDNSKYFLQDAESVEPFLKEGWAQVIIIKYYWITCKNQSRGHFERHFKGPMSFSLMRKIFEAEVYEYDVPCKHPLQMFELTDIAYGPQEKIIDGLSYRGVT